MFRELRRFDAPELDAWSRAVEVRVPALRVTLLEGKNIASDFALMERATPFTAQIKRPALTLVLEGAGRWDELGRRAWTDPGDIILSDSRMGATEAYAGPTTSVLILHWDVATLGVAVAGAAQRTRFGARDLARFRELAAGLHGHAPRRVAIEMLDRLRAHGVRFAKLTEGDLVQEATEDESRLSAAIGHQLARLGTHPSIDDVGNELGWSSRHVNRRFAELAKNHGLTFHRWRSLLHHTRMLMASRLLAAPGATTELIARLTGFRSPSALCHAFAKAGWPSPGVLARVAKRDVLDAWAPFGETAVSKQVA